MKVIKPEEPQKRIHPLKKIKKWKKNYNKISFLIIIGQLFLTKENRQNPNATLLLATTVKWWIICNGQFERHETKCNDRNKKENNENWMHKNGVGPLYALSHDTHPTCVHFEYIARWKIKKLMKYKTITSPNYWTGTRTQNVFYIVGNSKKKHSNKNGLLFCRRNRETWLHEIGKGNGIARETNSNLKFICGKIDLFHSAIYQRAALFHPDAYCTDDCLCFL